MAKKRREEQRGNDASSTDMRKKSLENGPSDRMPLEEIPPGNFLEMLLSILRVLTEILRSMQVKERMEEKYEKKYRKLKEQQGKKEEKWEKKYRKIKTKQKKMTEQQGEMNRQLEEIKENGTLNSSRRAQPDQSQRPRFRLRFNTSVNKTIYKGKSIRTGNGDCVEVHLYDDDAHQIVRDHPLSSAKVKLVVLNGEFNKDDDQDYWSKEDFEKSIRAPREGNSTLGNVNQKIESIVDNCTFNLSSGIGRHHGAIILDNSNRKKVRLGVMVVGRPEERVLEGISNPFKVQEAKTERNEPAGGGQPSCTQMRENEHVLPVNVQQQSSPQVPMPNLSQPTITRSVEHGQHQGFPLAAMQNSSQSASTQMLEDEPGFVPVAMQNSSQTPNMQLMEFGQGHAGYDERQSFPRATTPNLSQPCSNQILGNGLVLAGNDQQSFPQFSMQCSSQPTVITQSLQYGGDQAVQIPLDWVQQQCTCPPSNSRTLCDNTQYPHLFAGSSTNQQQVSFTQGHHESAGDVHHLDSQTQNQVISNFKSGNGGPFICGQVQLLWDKPDMQQRQSWDILDKLMPLYTRHSRVYSGLFPDTSLVHEYDWLLATDYFLKMMRVLGITDISSRGVHAHQNRGVLIQSIEPNDSEDEPLFRRKRHAQYQLRFVNEVCKEYYTREQIKAEDGDLLKVALYSEDNLRITSGPLSSASVEIVLLHGDFNADGQDYWSSEEFSKQTLCSQSGKEPTALGGDRVLILTDGEASLGNVAFHKTSFFARTGKFKMGVKMKLALEVRVKEGITKPFLVRSREGEGSNKNCTPSVVESVGALTKSSEEVCTALDDARLFAEQVDKFTRLHPEVKESFCRASAAEVLTSGVQASGAACGLSAVGQPPPHHPQQEVIVDRFSYEAGKKITKEVSIARFSDAAVEKTEAMLLAIAILFVSSIIATLLVSPLLVEF